MTCELNDLVAGQVVDIGTNVGDDLRRHILIVLLCVGDRLVRRVCLPIPVAKREDRPGWGQGVADLAPVVGIPGLVRPTGVAASVGNLWA
jgi:hypothetical protein